MTQISEVHKTGSKESDSQLLSPAAKFTRIDHAIEILAKMELHGYETSAPERSIYTFAAHIKVAFGALKSAYLMFSIEHNLSASLLAQASFVADHLCPISTGGRGRSIEELTALKEVEPLIKKLANARAYLPGAQGRAQSANADLDKFFENFEEAAVDVVRIANIIGI